MDSDYERRAEALIAQSCGVALLDGFDPGKPPAWMDDRPLDGDESMPIQSSPAWCPDSDRLTLDALIVQPPAPRFVIAGLLPADVTATVGTGGVGKSTINLQRAIHIILARPWLGFDVEMPGPVVLVTAEDDRSRIEWRLFHIANQMALTRPERERVARNLYIRDFCGTQTKLAKLDGHGNLVSSGLSNLLVERYAEIEPVLIEFDPLVKFSPGERHVNDGEDSVINECMRIRRALGCCVDLTHHVSKMVVRDGVIDHLAGRGGSALGDGARGVFQLVTEKDEATVAQIATKTELESGDVIALHCTKLTDAARPKEPIYLFRNGWLFEPRYMPTEEEADIARRTVEEERLDMDICRIVDFLADGLRSIKPIRYTAKTIETAPCGVGRNRLRHALHVAEARGAIKKVDLPPDEKQGRRTYFYAPGKWS